MINSRHFIAQQRFGYFVCIVGIVVSAFNLISLIANGESVTVTSIFTDFAILLFISLIGFLTTRKESVIVQVFQVNLIFVVALMAIINYDAINDLTGEAMAILGIYMAIQFGFLKKHFYLKMISFIVLLSATKFFILAYKFQFFSADVVNVESISSFIGQYALLAATVILLWLLTKDQIQEYIQQGKGIEEKFNQNSVFIDIGKIVWGFLHDLGNLSYSLVDVRMLERQLDILSKSDKVEPEKLKVCVENARRIEKMLSAVDSKQEQIKKMIKAKHVIARDRIDINDMIQNLVNYLKITYNMRGIAVVLTLCSQKVYIYASPFEVLQAIENIVRNSLEAMLENNGKRLEICTSFENGKVKILISDTGGGIKFIEKDGKVDLDEFQIGKTTKESQGTGWGMYTSIRNIQHNAGHLHITTQKDVGTVFEISFDLV